MSATPLLDVEDLRVEFSVRRSASERTKVRAVDGVTLAIDGGETLGLVGESGSGKSSAARAIMQIEPLAGGSVRFAGQDLSRLRGARLRRARRRFQMVFQDPGSSLDPRQSVIAAVTEPLDIHDVGERADRRVRALELLERVGLGASFAGRYAHELSGGQQQRVAIARALSAGPELIVCDEPVSALDVSVRAQIINLLEDLQDELSLAYLFIAHDLAVVRQIADRVAVMYLGRLVESGPCDQVYARPLHPYTKALLSAIPVPDAHAERRRERIVLRGELPSPVDVPSGCRFRSRCPWAREVCSLEDPEVRVTEGGHAVACHFHEEIEQQAPVVAPVERKDER